MANTADARLIEWIEGFRDLQKRKGERKFQLDDNVADIERRLLDRRWFRTRERDLNRDDVGAISVDLESISFWYARQGLVAVWGGNVNGWQDIQRALLFRYWNARLFRRLWPDGCDWITETSRHAHVFCHALVTGQQDEARWLGQDLCAQARPGSKTRFAPGRVENFVVWLYGQWSGNTSSMTGHPLGAYEMVVDAWTSNGDALTNALRLLLDWRLAHTNEDDPNDTKIEWGYDTQPYDFWPVEVLAMERVRQEQGLPPIQWPRHALLDTPLWKQPPPVGQALPHDELVERVVVAVRNLYPHV